MIGLCRGLAHRAYHDVRRNPGAFSWKDAANFEPCFGLIASRNKVAPSVVNPEDAFPVSFRYFALLDACPLRMSSALGE